MKKNMFIGQFVSKNESILDKRISQAGNNYQLKFLEMFNPSVAISIYPIFLRGKQKDNLDNIQFVNNQSIFPFFLNKIYRFFFDTIQVLFLIKKAKTKNVFFYNIDKQNFLIIFLSKFLLNTKTFIVLADYSYFLNESWFDKFCNFMIKNVNGLLVLNSNIKLNKNQKTLPGLIKLDQVINKHKSGINKNIIFSGSLGYTTGLEVVLDAFSKRSDYNLFITGRPYNLSDSEFNKLILSYTKSFNNIKYLGLLNYDGYQEILNTCDIALSLRNPLDIEHQYNFPSKILEYLSNSKIVISSLTYEDLPKEFLFSTKFDSLSLLHALDEIFKLENSFIMELKFNISKYIEDQFTEAALKKITNNLTENHVN